MAKYATVPVINGLTDQSHPCQIMADLMTIKEHKGTLEGLKFAWLGDGNNVSASFIHASPKFGFALDMACPAGYRPNQGLIESANAEGGKVRLTDMDSALEGADVVVTDCWVSMGMKIMMPAWRHLPPIRSTRPPWHRPRMMRSSCIACRHIATRKSPMR